MAPNLQTAVTGTSVPTAGVSCARSDSGARQLHARVGRRGCLKTLAWLTCPYSIHRSVG